MTNRNKVLALVATVLAVILLVAGGLYLARPKDDPSAAGSASPTSEPESSTSSDASPEPGSEESNDASSTAEPSASESGPALECTTTTEGFTPVKYTFEGSMDVDETILALGEDEAGNIAAPPPAEKRTASWWMNGPKPGTPGKTILSIHTYRKGGALGNEMYEGGESQLKPGDLIKLHGENGEVACYEFTEAKRIMVEDYDPDSDVMIDWDGESEVAIIICWDFDKDADEEAGEDPWESRVFFYGKLV